MRRLCLAMAVLALLGAACAKKEPGTSSGSGPPVTLSGQVTNKGTKDLTGDGSNVSLTLEQDDNYFSPTFIKAMPGATVNVEVENEGKNQHTFTIDALKVDQVVPAGTKKELTLTLPADGVVNFYCRFHRPAGMQGALFFTEGSSPAPAGSNAGGGYGYGG